MQNHESPARKPRGPATPPTVQPSFAPLVPACAAHGIRKSRAYALANAGMLATFTLGVTRMVDLESLRTLPQRLASAAPEDLAKVSSYGRRRKRAASATKAVNG